MGNFGHTRFLGVRFEQANKFCDSSNFYIIYLRAKKLKKLQLQYSYRPKTRKYNFTIFRNEITHPKIDAALKLYKSSVPCITIPCVFRFPQENTLIFCIR